MNLKAIRLLLLSAALAAVMAACGGGTVEPPTPTVSFTTYLERGDEYIYQGDYQKSIEQFDEAIRLDPQYAAAYNSRAIAYGRQLNYAHAVKDLDEAIRLDPQESIYYKNRGLYYELLGKDTLAERDMEKAISLATPTPAFGPIRTTIDQLLDEHESNAVAANLKYGNKDVEMWGRVFEVGIYKDSYYFDPDLTSASDTDQYFLDLIDPRYSAEYYAFEHPPVICILPSIDQAVAMKKEDQVLVTGKIVEDYYLEYPMLVMYPCHLADGSY